MRKVALVEEPNLVFLAGVSSVYDLAQEALARKNRNAMHNLQADQMADSMRIFQWALDGGKPMEGCIGPAPEWFYKGTGHALRGHGEALVITPYADDGGEEAEVSACYVRPRTAYRSEWAWQQAMSSRTMLLKIRATLNLAGSKLRTCALGPELVIDPEFGCAPGTMHLQRNGETIWSSVIRTGKEEMCHTVRTSSIITSNSKVIGYRAMRTFIFLGRVCSALAQGSPAGR